MGNFNCYSPQGEETDPEDTATEEPQQNTETQEMPKGADAGYGHAQMNTNGAQPMDMQNAEQPAVTLPAEVPPQMPDGQQPATTLPAEVPPPDAAMGDQQMSHNMYGAQADQQLTIDGSVDQFGAQTLPAPAQPDMGHVPPMDGYKMDQQFGQPTNGVMPKYDQHMAHTNGAYPMNGVSQFGANSIDGSGMTVVQTGQPQFITSPEEVGIPAYDVNGAAVQEFVMTADGQYVPINQASSGLSLDSGVPAEAPAPVSSRQLGYM